MRLEARGLLSKPADRMRKDDEVMKQEILDSLESTKLIELKKAKRQVKQEEASLNMQRKMRAEEYKNEKILAKMASDEEKLKKVTDEREAIKVKREIAANNALIERNRVQEMAKKALGGKNMVALLENGVDTAAMVSSMLGVKTPADKKEKKERRVVVGIRVEEKKEEIEDFKEIDDNENSKVGFDMSGSIRSTTDGNATLTPVVNPYAEVDEIRKRQNTELLGILTEEQAAEESREALLRGLNNVSDSERQGMKERFARERHDASNRLLRYTKAHEETLAAAVEAANKQRELGECQMRLRDTDRR